MRHPARSSEVYSALGENRWWLYAWEFHSWYSCYSMYFLQLAEYFSLSLSCWPCILCFATR